jgi:leader peptidase (prepilin peptidase)/N-methyltransferase
VITGLIGGLVVFAYNYLYSFTYYGNIAWWVPLVAMLFGPVVLIILAIVGSAIFKADAMGGGDIKLFAPIGLFLGLKMTVLALFLSFIVAGVVGIILLISKKKERKSAIPFGPFIVVATYITMMWGNQILDWYLYGLTY